MAVRSSTSKFLAFSRWFLLGACLPSLIACSSFTPIFSKGIWIASEQRSQAEGYVRIVNRLSAEGRINEEQHAEAKMLYLQSRRAFNAWIDQLGRDLEREREVSTEYQETLGEAVVKTDRFIRTVYRLAFGGPHVKIVEVVPSPEESLTRAGVEISKQFTRAGSEHQRGILQTLQTLKWRSFDDIVNEA